MRNRRAAGGFTLVEMLAVVVIIGVFASLAIVSVRRSRQSSQVDAFANQIRNVCNTARRRAVATRTRYVVWVQANSVAYCQVDPADPTQASCPTPATAACNGAAGDCESSTAYSTGTEGTVVQYARDADFGQGVATAALPSGGAAVWFLPNGTADSNLQTTVAEGFTIYLQGAVQTSVRRKVVLSPAAGRPRIIDTW